MSRKKKRSRRKQRRGGPDPKLWANWLAYLKGGEPPAPPPPEAEAARRFCTGEIELPPSEGHPALVAAAAHLLEEARRGDWARRRWIRERLELLEEHPSEVVRREAVKAQRAASLIGRFQLKDGEHVGYWAGISTRLWSVVEVQPEPRFEQDRLLFVLLLPTHSLAPPKTVPSFRPDRDAKFWPAFLLKELEDPMGEQMLAAPVTRQEASWLYDWSLKQRQRFSRDRLADELSAEFHAELRQFLGPVPEQFPPAAALEGAEPLTSEDLDRHAEALGPWLGWISETVLLEEDLAHLLLRGTETGLVVSRGRDLGQYRVARQVVQALRENEETRERLLVHMAMHVGALRRLNPNDELGHVYGRFWKALAEGLVPDAEHPVWSWGMERLVEKLEGLARRRVGDQEEEGEPVQDRLVWTLDDVVEAASRQSDEEENDDFGGGPEGPGLIVPP